MAREHLKKELCVHAEQALKHKSDAPLATPSQVKQALKRKPDAPLATPRSKILGNGWILPLLPNSQRS
jgi:hypothetical protein